MFLDYIVARRRTAPESLAKMTGLLSRQALPFVVAVRMCGPTGKKAEADDLPTRLAEDSGAL
jgi:hypothetical protein